MFDEIKEMLKGLGIKYTKQRGMVVNALQGADLPVTAEQLLEQVRKLDPAISLSTIYRALDVLVNHGLVLRASFADEKRSMYSLERMEHKHYLICTMCNRMEPIEGCPLAAYEEQLAEKTNFRISAHKLEMHGICPECQKKGV